MGVGKTKAIPHLTFWSREGGGGKEGKSVRQKMKKKGWEGEKVLIESKKYNTKRACSALTISDSPWWPQPGRMPHPAKLRRGRTKNARLLIDERNWTRPTLCVEIWRRIEKSPQKIDDKGKCFKKKSKRDEDTQFPSPRASGYRIVRGLTREMW